MTTLVCIVADGKAAAFAAGVFTLGRRIRSRRPSGRCVGLSSRRAFSLRTRVSRAQVLAWNRWKMPAARAASGSGPRIFRRFPNWSWLLPGRPTPAGGSAIPAAAASSGERNGNRSSCDHMANLSRSIWRMGPQIGKLLEGPCSRSGRLLADLLFSLQGRGATFDASDNSRSATRLSDAQRAL